MHIKLRVTIEKNINILVIFPRDLKKEDYERITLTYHVRQ